MARWVDDTAGEEARIALDRLKQGSKGIKAFIDEAEKLNEKAEYAEDHLQKIIHNRLKEELRRAFIAQPIAMERGNYEA